MNDLPIITEKIDGFEYHPCMVVGHTKDGAEIVEQCEPDEADFWSVYAHCSAGGLQCIADFDTENECIKFIGLLESIILNYEN